MNISASELAELETLVQAIDDPRARIEALFQLWKIVYANNPVGGLTYADEALTRAEALNDECIVAYCLFACGLSHHLNLHPSEGLTCFTRSYELFSGFGDHQMEFQCRDFISKCYIAMGNYTPALDIALQNLAGVDEQPENLVIRAHVRLGEIYFYLHDYPKALHHTFTAVNYGDRKGRKDHQQAVSYDLLSTIYDALEQEETGYPYRIKSLAIARATGARRSEAITLTKLALYHAKRQEFPEALEYVRQAQGVEGQEHLVPFLIHGWVRVYDLTGDEEKALEGYAQSLGHVLKLGLVNEARHIYNLIGQLYYRQQNYEKALEYFVLVQQYMEDGLDTVHPEFYQYFSHTYEQLGDLANALAYHKKYSDAANRAGDQEKQKAIAEMQAKFDVESAEREKELLRAKNEALTAALGEVRRLNNNLTKLDSEKNEVLGIVAHDLKSPILGVRMVASLLADHCERMPGDELRRQLQQIVDTSDRMLSISSNLLKAQHIENGDVYAVKTQVDVSAVVRDLVESYRAAAQQKRIELAVEVQPDIKLLCSEEAVRQAVENVVSNAVKFTLHGKRVGVRVQRKAKGLVVEVKDEGPGIRASERRKLFGKYVRLSARPTGGESSTGVGLWIAKKAVDSLQGKIHCRSVPGAGSVFTIELPYHP